MNSAGIRPFRQRESLEASSVIAAPLHHGTTAAGQEQ